MDFSGVMVCPDGLLSAALRRVHDGLSADQQTALIATLNALGEQSAADFAGLLVVQEGLGLAAACWVQVTPGNSATLWPPEFSHPAAPRLLRAAAEFLSQQGITFAQMVKASSDPIDEGLLAVGGFRRLVDLAYLRYWCAPPLIESQATELQFVPHAMKYPQRVQQLLHATYTGTLDCPELNNTRPIGDVIESYQNQGTYRPDQWYLICQGQQDIGVLILAEHAHQETWELVYMGVVPGVRGQAFGGEIVREAARRVLQAGGRQIVLAVDVRNLPAREMYRQAGFTEWDRRTVYTWIAEP